MKYDKIIMLSCSMLILLFFIWVTTKPRNFCEKSKDFKVCDKDSVCVNVDQEFCEKFPDFSPECNKYPPNVGPICPSPCKNANLVAKSRLCYNAAACASRDLTGKWTGDYADCNNNKEFSICENKGCFSCKDPVKICPSSCYKKDPYTGKSAMDCYSEEGCAARLPDGTWDPSTVYDKCNPGNEDVEKSCNYDFGCDWAKCPQIPTDLCRDNKCDPNGTYYCNPMDGSCTCMPGWKGENCGIHVQSRLPLFP